MNQLIKITTVPIEYELKINDAQISRKRGNAEVEISRVKGGMQIKSKPIKLNLDTFEARSSITPSTAGAIKQAASAGTQSAYSATAQFAQEGKMLLSAKIGDGSQALNSIYANRVALPTGDMEMTFLPTTGPEIDWEAAELSIQYEMDKLNFDAKINSGSIEFVPGSIELVITQQPDIVVEYIGPPIYVPPSAAEFFGGGEVVDVEA